MATRYPDPDELVGSNIREWRTKAGWTQPELAERLAELGWNLDAPAIAKIESGKRSVRVGQLFILGQALGVFPMDLVQDTSVEASRVQVDKYTKLAEQRLREGLYDVLALRERAWQAARAGGADLIFTSLSDQAASMADEIEQTTRWGHIEQSHLRETGEQHA